MSRPLWSGFAESAARVPHRAALEVKGRGITYGELDEQARCIAASIQAHDDGASELTAVFGSRSVVTFAGVLGALMAGHGYVPLNPAFPPARTRQMLVRAGCRTLVADPACDLDALLREPIPHAFTVVLPDAPSVSSLRERWPQHRFVGAADLATASTWRPPAAAGDSPAYLLFTSGSTGQPKGVLVTHANVRAFVDFMVERYEVTSSDRFSQMFDLTFDLSAFDMFVCWERGACLCCPSRKEAINPSSFIRNSGLTVWFSVPSTAVFMKRLGGLSDGRFSSLRLSLFCGEPLPETIAQAWAAAAPNAVIENLYGPTELTIACTMYRWQTGRSEAECELGVVPIGHPYPGMKTLVMDEGLREVAPGEVGELLMTGPQMSKGYWQDPDRTAAAFLIPPGCRDVYYRTGDRVRRPIGDAPLTHLGRMDGQVKILGHRVELGEIEALVRRFTGFDGVVAAAWPPSPGGYAGVEVFVEGDAADGEAIRAQLATELPAYMVPRRIHLRERLPRNANNKFDRAAMTRWLEDGL
jgi:amino acid adenylation domain-containing protein